MSTRTRTDWILWAQLGCALVATAHAEYTLASATGLHWVVAGAVPGALDLYVIRALQKHKDVLPAVLVMVAANVASILVSAGVLPLHWGLYSAVGALVPLLVWRGHVLRVHPGTDAGAVSAPVPAVPEERVHVPETDETWLPEFLAEQVHPSAPALGIFTPAEQDEYEGEYTSTPALPPLPPEYIGEYTEIVHSVELSEADLTYLPQVQAYLEECAVASTHPTVRGLKKYASVGQPRAERLLEYMEVQP